MEVAKVLRVFLRLPSIYCLETRRSRLQFEYDHCIGSEDNGVDAPAKAIEWVLEQ